MEFYSQFEQDKFLYENFLVKKNGYFVDIGAHDGITGSNSYFFEKLGWDGICFEPIPSVFDKLKTNRQCELKNLAISDKCGVEKFLCIDGYSEMLSGIVSTYSNEHIMRINRDLENYNQTFDYIDVNCSTFNDEISITNIDLLSIDTEGSEKKIIYNIDFNKYNISFLLFEMNYHDKELIDYILQNNFEYIKSLGVDLLFKKK